METFEKKGAHSLFRYKHKTTLFDPESGKEINLLEHLKEHGSIDYDEVLVGYDKHPELQIGPPREPVFRYSVRIPESEQFCQEEPDTVYWFSAVAVYMEGTDPAFPWGWTNHEKFYNHESYAIPNR